LSDIQDIFSWEPALRLANSQAAADDEKKTIAIFSIKQRLLIIDMKTKVVQHV